MDKAWKAHERKVAEFFHTKRALHGVDRDQGEVLTDVFVDGSNLPIIDEEFRPLEDYAIFVECKYTASGSSSNAWMLPEVNKLLKGLSKEEKASCFPVLATRDGWYWMQMEYFPYFLLDKRYRSLHSTDKASKQPVFFHKNKKMSVFFENAISQAEKASLPKRIGPDSRFPYSHRVHIVCVGSNLRVPKCIGVPSNGIFDI